MSAEDKAKPLPIEKGAGRTLLVVNDDEDALFLLARCIQRAVPGAKILRAADGQVAFALWQKERVDVMLTDNRMPHMTGLMLTREIRKTDTSMPIIMVTGSARDREEALKAGVTVFYAEGHLAGVIEPLRQCLAQPH